MTKVSKSEKETINVDNNVSLKGAGRTLILTVNDTVLKKTMKAKEDREVIKELFADYDKRKEGSKIKEKLLKKLTDAMTVEVVTADKKKESANKANKAIAKKNKKAATSLKKKLDKSKKAASKAKTKGKSKVKDVASTPVVHIEQRSYGHPE